MKRETTVIPAILLALSCLAVTIHARASEHPHGHHHGQHATSGDRHMPYAGLQERGIKALSAQQIEDLRAGRGMSQALAAELNGYPGPLHALELADQLGLAGEQRQQVEALYEAMQRQASELGVALIEAERELDRLFRSRTATAGAVEAQTQEIARIQGRLRAVHLQKHLDMVDILSAEQVATYNRLRGY